MLPVRTNITLTLGICSRWSQEPTFKNHFKIAGHIYGKLGECYYCCYLEKKSQLLVLGLSLECDNIQMSNYNKLNSSLG